MILSNLNISVFPGYGVDSDFKNLVSTCRLFENAVTRLARFVDLCPLSKQVGQRLFPIMRTESRVKYMTFATPRASNSQSEFENSFQETNSIWFLSCYPGTLLDNPSHRSM